MAKKEAVPNRQCTAEFRQEAVRLAGGRTGTAHRRNWIASVSLPGAEIFCAPP